jgi:hypothetical protein
MDVARKLQLAAEQVVVGLRVPESAAAALAGLPLTQEDSAGAALLAFVRDRAALEEVRARIVASARDDRLTWVAYPKAGQLGTDLNRDTLAALLIESGIDPVRQIAIDEVWSALRFR